MTKEEIIIKNVPGDCIWNEAQHLINTPFEYVYNAMNEHARQISIGFAKWKGEEGYTKIYHYNDDNDGKWYDENYMGINRHYYTTEQLYNEYLESLNK